VNLPRSLLQCEHGGSLTCPRVASKQAPFVWTLCASIDCSGESSCPAFHGIDRISGSARRSSSWSPDGFALVLLLRCGSGAGVVVVELSIFTSPSNLRSAAGQGVATGNTLEISRLSLAFAFAPYLYNDELVSKQRHYFYTPINRYGGSYLMRVTPNTV